MKQRGITLIGMPATGKSTVGTLLAEALGYAFLDVDRWMEQREGMRVKEIIQRKGRDYILDLEYNCLLTRDLHELIVSPPGSIIYTPIQPKLAQESFVVLLDTSFEILEARLQADATNERGIINLEPNGLRTLYASRMPLYRQWAQLDLICDDKSPSQIVAELIAALPPDALHPAR